MVAAIVHQHELTGLHRRRREASHHAIGRLASYGAAIRPLHKHRLVAACIHHQPCFQNFARGGGHLAAAAPMAQLQCLPAQPLHAGGLTTLQPELLQPVFVEQAVVAAVAGGAVGWIGRVAAAGAEVTAGVAPAVLQQVAQA